MNPWLIAADRGGTFTDCLSRDPMGRVRRCKVLSRGVLRMAVEQRIGAQTLMVRLPEEDLPEAVVLRAVGVCGVRREHSDDSGG